MNRIISRSFVVRLALSLALAGCLSGNALAQQTGWPRSFSNSGGSLVLYQPQVDDWKNYSVVNARSAFALTPTGGKECVGVVTFTLQSVVDMDKHTVFLYSPSITNIYLQPPNTNSAPLESLVRTFINPSATMNISIEKLTASLQAEDCADARHRG